MLIAQKQPAGPAWKTIMGAQVLFAPIDRAMLRRARRAALKALGRHDEAAAADQTEDQAIEQLEELGDALSLALIMEGAQDWRDVARQLLDENDAPILDTTGQPQFETLDFSAENLAATLSDPIVFEAFDAAYVVPFAARERAKNGSAASPNGTGVAGTRANDTVSSRAARRKAAAAKRAPTASKPRKSKKPKASGTS